MTTAMIRESRNTICVTESHNLTEVPIARHSVVVVFV